ncbi:RCC1-like domain-containing protein [Streptomyces sp. NPDC059552]|uniref:RCC1-like domain-containing protein n=1 Tax=Streptomyces sp. NPDC059552 TaxID=3346862 RepID=UPI0036AAA935
MSSNADGAVVLSWGAGRTGQLGNGTTSDSLSPTAVTGLNAEAVTKLSAGGVSVENGFALALLKDGTVRAWGDNVAGQIGNGTLIDQTVPVMVASLTGIKDIAAGGTHALALTEGGRVFSWGDNAYGQLGHGTSGGERSKPAEISGLTGVKQIAAGADFSLALLTDGTVRAWGRGIHGQLGNGSRATSTAPCKVGLTDIVAIAAGAHHALALTTDDTVKSWGYNLHGQLGNSSTESSTVPVDVDWLEGVSEISTGAHHNYAKTSDSHVWGWGDNQYGQLLEGDETFDSDVSRTNRTAPVEIPRLEGVQFLDGGARHGVALTADAVFTWGDNSHGQLGHGTTVPGYGSVKIPNTSIRFIAAGRGGGATYVC